MQLTMLGSGNAAGMPVYGCQCEYCMRALYDASLVRTHCSALLTVGDKQYLIDAGQTNLQQRFPAGSIDAIFITHFHPDHVQGLLDLRWGKDLSIPVYTPDDEQGCADLYKYPGILDFQKKPSWQTFYLDELSITAVPLCHSKPTSGYIFQYEKYRLAYLTDTKGLSAEAIDYLNKKPLNIMLIDCSFKPNYNGKGHNNLDDVMAICERVKPQQTVLMHIGHDFDIWLQTHADTLPENIVVSRDNMVISCS